VSSAAQPERKGPLFVDDVDKVVEFRDTCAENLAAPREQELPSTQRPLLTDVVDRLVEFVDGVPGGGAAPTVLEGGGQRQPILVDSVDKVVEFADQPDPRLVPNSLVQPP
jgi:hypothetical protein